MLCTRWVSFVCFCCLLMNNFLFCIPSITAAVVVLPMLKAGKGEKEKRIWKVYILHCTVEVNLAHTDKKQSTVIAVRVSLPLYEVTVTSWVLASVAWRQEATANPCADILSTAVNKRSLGWWCPCASKSCVNTMPLSLQLCWRVKIVELFRSKDKCMDLGMNYGLHTWNLLY